MRRNHDRVTPGMDSLVQTQEIGAVPLKITNLAHLLHEPHVSQRNKTQMRDQEQEENVGKMSRSSIFSNFNKQKELLD